jgi:hypothetical protein
MLNSLTALVFFLYGGLGFPSLPPLPLEKPPPLLRNAAPGLAPEQIGQRLVLLTQRLEFASPPEAARDLPQMAFLPDPKLKAEINLLIKKYAKRHGVDEKLIRAVLQKESGGNPIAVSPKGAMGLMQLMPETAQSLGVEDPFNPEQNLAAGVKFLKSCLNLFCQDVALALAAYNAGPETVKKYGGVPPYPETQQYVAGILGRPVEDIMKKSSTTAGSTTAEEKSQSNKLGSPQATKSAVNLPNPAWKVVHANVTIPAVKWRIPPSLTSLNPIPLKSDPTPDAAKCSKDASHLPKDTKEAASTGTLAIPKFFQNYGYR